MERRNFLSLLSLGTAGVILGGSLTNCSKATPMTASLPNAGLKLDLSTAKYAGLLNRGGAVTVNNDIIVAHVSTGEYVAVSNICTHEGCTVGFDGSSTFQCPCHGAQFDKNGSVLRGPATRALQKYTTQLSGNILTITG